MNPALLVLAGPLKGNRYEISDEDVIIGREQRNSLSLIDACVSLQHCVIRRNGEGCTITDLDSKKGTFVNGMPTKKRVLRHGDKIEIADSLLLYVTRDFENEEQRIFLADFEVTPSVRLRMEDVLYLHPQKLLQAVPVTTRIARGLETVFNVSQAVSSICEPSELFNRLFDLLFAAVPAQRAIVLVKDDRDEYSSVFACHDGGSINQSSPVPRSNRYRPAVISRSLIEEARREGTALLYKDFSATLSAEISVLLAPLELHGRTIGFLYVETCDGETRFDEDYLHLVAAIANVLTPALDNLDQFTKLEQENQRLRHDLSIQHNIIGESAAIVKVLEFVSRVAPSDSTVLILGESGTGKELVARALHENSPRSEKPFVAINCASLSETLLESELFGYEKGAFTGAVSRKIGKMQIADKGTLFLDEIGELPLALQARLLRVLQEKRFERVGGTDSIEVDVRIIAATNRNLEAAVKSREFRDDLYYRLNVIQLTMPSLRERVDDIPLLATYFAAKHSARTCRRHIGISPEVRACLMNYAWPGNVRELENAIERAIVLGTSDVILLEDLPETIIESQASGNTITNYHEAVKAAKREILLKALEKSKGNLSEAARSLGIHPNNLHRMINDLHLRPLIR